MHNESSFTTIDEHNCVIQISSLDEGSKFFKVYQNLVTMTSFFVFFT